MAELEGNGAQRLLAMFGNSPKGIEVKLGTINTGIPEVSLTLEDETIATPKEGLILSDTVMTKATPGTQVICIVANDGQIIYVIDKAVL